MESILAHIDSMDKFAIMPCAKFHSDMCIYIRDDKPSNISVLQTISTEETVSDAANDGTAQMHNAILYMHIYFYRLSTGTDEVNVASCFFFRKSWR